MRIGEAPVGKLCVAAFLLTNMRNCVDPNSIAQCFGHRPLFPEEYLIQRDSTANKGISRSGGQSAREVACELFPFERGFAPFIRSQTHLLASQSDKLLLKGSRIVYRYIYLRLQTISRTTLYLSISLRLRSSISLVY